MRQSQCDRRKVKMMAVFGPYLPFVLECASRCDYPDQSLMLAAAFSVRHVYYADTASIRLARGNDGVGAARVRTH